MEICFIQNSLLMRRMIKTILQRNIMTSDVHKIGKLYRIKLYIDGSYEKELVSKYMCYCLFVFAF